jgi:hypothetical protein
MEAECSAKVVREKPIGWFNSVLRENGRFPRPLLVGKLWITGGTLNRAYRRNGLNVVVPAWEKPAPINFTIFPVPLLMLEECDRAAKTVDLVDEDSV